MAIVKGPYDLKVTYTEDYEDPDEGVYLGVYSNVENSEVRLIQGKVIVFIKESVVDEKYEAEKQNLEVKK